MSNKYNLDLFPFCCGLLFDVIHVPWIEACWLLISNSYPLDTVINRIPYTTYKSIYYSEYTRKSNSKMRSGSDINVTDNIATTVTKPKMTREIES